MTERRPIDLGRRLRVLAGVDERLLARVPLERTRYTGLGGVVLSTSVIAGISMWFFLSQMLGRAHPAALVLVVVWSLIVLNLDRWLVSTVTGRWQRRLTMLVPRLAVATVLGFVIAEPLVLRFFETAVVAHVVEGREKARSALRDTLIRCNPAPPARPPAGECGEGTRLTPETPAEASATLRTLRAERDKVAVRLAAAQRKHAGLLSQATKECDGTDGPGLSGKKGYGPRCVRATEIAKEFAREHVDPDAATLKDLDGRILPAGAVVATANAGYKQRIKADIDQRLASLPTKNDTVGLLERKRALDELTGSDVFLWTFTWLMRLLMLLIDCLPVLVKLMGGTSYYDRLVEEENKSQERLHKERIETHEHAEAGELRLKREEKAEDLRKRKRALQADARSHVSDLINRRTSDLMHREPSVNGSRR
ncbi:DUF4407 domain-containing protein [Nonomuraea sp. NPDC059007]|uniref:DUF4407 domain-containing protein n=1 Tax=Nonomuraea sp. NPDC059007 TaxID=3346692 RepID=UPI0036AE001F